MIDRCIDTGYDDDGPVLFTRKMRSARREHECCECGSVIKPGDKYEHVRGLWDGEWRTFKTCRVCEAVRADFFMSFVYGTLWETMREVYGLGFDTVEEPGKFDKWDWDDNEWAVYVKRVEASRKSVNRARSSIRFLDGRGDGLKV